METRVRVDLYRFTKFHKAYFSSTGQPTGDLWKQKYDKNFNPYFNDTPVIDGKPYEIMAIETLPWVEDNVRYEIRSFILKPIKGVHSGVSEVAARG